MITNPYGVIIIINIIIIMNVSSAMNLQEINQVLSVWKALRNSRQYQFVIFGCKIGCRRDNGVFGLSARKHGNVEAAPAFIINQ